MNNNKRALLHCHPLSSIRSTPDLHTLSTLCPLVHSTYTIFLFRVLLTSHRLRSQQHSKLKPGTLEMPGSHSPMRLRGAPPPMMNLYTHRNNRKQPQYYSLQPDRQVSHTTTLLFRVSHRPLHMEWIVRVKIHLQLPVLGRLPGYDVIIDQQSYAWLDLPYQNILEVTNIAILAFSEYYSTPISSFWMFHLNLFVPYRRS